MRPQKTEQVPVEKLRLDPLNPRLVGGAEGASDEAIIARLYRAAELSELLPSISANGYLDIEPLVVIRAPERAGLIVLEGNRRLAALRILREPDLARRIASSERLRMTVPTVEESLRATLDRVTVYSVTDREEARAFIGFKHINGPAKWDAYAKARFAALWYKAGRPDGVSLTDIAGAIGDRHATIKRMVSAIYVLEQAEDENLFDIEDRHTRKFNFSHLYTALSRSQYMAYLGLGAAWARHDPEPNQVPRERLDELRKVLVWIYGFKKNDTRPVVRSQNPDIKRLGEVLSHPQGRHVLEATGDLDAAHRSIVPVDAQFTASLIRARDHIRDAAGSLRAYDGRDQALLDIAADIKETADIVHARMAKKLREASTAE